MGLPEFLRVNNNPFAWQDCEFSIDLLRYQELTSLSYADSRKRKKVKAMKRSGTPLGRTTGSYELDTLSFKILTGALHNKLIPQLGLIAATQGKPGSYGDAVFNMQLKIWQPGLGAESIVVTFNNCWIEAPKDDFAESIDELITDVTFGGETIDRGGDGKLWSVVADTL